MASILSCPQCRAAVGLPDQTHPRTRVRCPICRNEYELETALHQPSPTLIVVEAASDDLSVDDFLPPPITPATFDPPVLQAEKPADDVLDLPIFAEEPLESPSVKASLGSSDIHHDFHPVPPIEAESIEDLPEPDAPLDFGDELTDFGAETSEVETFSFTEEPAPLPVETPAPAAAKKTDLGEKERKLLRPVPPAKKGSPVKTILGAFATVAVALPLASYAALWLAGEDGDFLKLYKYLPAVACPTPNKYARNPLPANPPANPPAAPVTPPVDPVATTPSTQAAPEPAPGIANPDSTPPEAAPPDAVAADNSAQPPADAAPALPPGTDPVADQVTSLPPVVESLDTPPADTLPPADSLPGSATTSEPLVSDSPMIETPPAEPITSSVPETPPATDPVVETPVAEPPAATQEIPPPVEVLGPREPFPFNVALIRDALTNAKEARERLLSGTSKETRKADVLTIYKLCEISTIASGTLAEATSLQKAENQFAQQLFAKPADRAMLGSLAAKWVKLAPEKREQIRGVLLVGEVKGQTTVGKLPATELLLSGDKNGAPVQVLSKEPLDCQTGDQVAIFASLIDAPAEQLVGYEGGEASAIWTNVLVKLPQ